MKTGLSDQLPRIWRWPYATFGDETKWDDDRADETVRADTVYTDKVLAEIASLGFDGIWVHGVLRNLAPTRAIPEFAPHWREHVSALRRLIKRAARHGIRAYIYMQPAQGMHVDDPFWRKNEDLRGAVAARGLVSRKPLPVNCLCTSSPRVKKFLRDAPERLLRELPELGGLILITASEFPAHCYSKYLYTRYRIGGGPETTVPLTCERCRERHPSDVVVEILGQIRNGVRTASPRAHVIAWNWSWTMYERDPSPRIVSRLPKDVILMAGFERGARKKIAGKIRRIDEYSLSYIGPSPRFRKTAALARSRGMRVMAKLQLGTTHELCTVPNLPLVGNLHDKASRLREMGVDGFMGCWNFGNMTSVNPVAFIRFFAPLPGGTASRRRGLLNFAAEYFPGCDAAGVVAAWEQFASAMDEYPFCISFIYMGPINYALSYPFKPGQAKETPLGRSWQMDPPGEWLEPKWIDGFEFGEFRPAIGRVMREWKKGARLFDRAVQTCSDDRTGAERDNAWVCYHVFRSTWNMYRVFELRRRWNDSKLPAYLKIAADELTHLPHVLPILDRDPRFGFHPEPQGQMFDAASVRRKIRALKRQVASAGGAGRNA
jgi:hypothetical protein